ncbi:ABC transporter ATP-binding protein [Paludisphaera borealis]|uniref:ABC-type polysaccharide/polyol phosphate transport system, ATPase component n=1 Tax=Paludisphaera borealis TaxID=1387353 RepID=A0A1U7CLU9_9BACT|nr:ABC transporter ATP-binding protein [Paludisphaera borealis]APW59901.1 ABC-type polysaccharide/polyol phosphate transport system, ATPase component [Paludisphaera borealis]
MSAVITAENVSKRYRIGLRRGGEYSTLRESIMDAASGTLDRVKRSFGTSPAPLPVSEEFWALKGVDLEIRRGEAVGIVGGNGAGKSTLLKVLSRITEPTEGRVEIEGRVGSLLEVGTGFHPELTGRENVFLNGAIIGMGRREVARKFDAIVDFAEIGQFIDTPVKRYSSGMYVRLAFAVAAHMEPDIFLIDEVLSVGDLAFQRKCMDHARSLLSRDATLLLVSHNMFAIKAICDRAVLLSKGRVALEGPTEDVIRAYDQAGRLDMLTWASGMVGSDPTKCPIYITDFEVMGEDGRPRTLFKHGESMRMRLHYEAQEVVMNPTFSVAVIRSDDTSCCNYNTLMDEFRTDAVSGSGAIELLTPPIKLSADLYSIHVLVWDGKFQRLYCAQAGKNFHVTHPVLSSEFGVFHEAARWSWAT